MDDVPHPDDTIAALASAPGSAPRGIVRVSGPLVREMLSRLFSPADPDRWSSAQRPERFGGTMALPGVLLPLAVDVLLWPTSRSYTGQPLAEIHTLGSPPLLEAILSCLFENGVRPAQRGEFTLRAFLAGRVDLMQAEAVLGVIDATDQQQLQVALGQLGGGLSGQMALLHEELLLHLADLEAGLDFVEEDIEFVSRDELNRRLESGIALLDALVRQADTRMQSTGRRRVVLAGLPNAGKSTLFNALLRDDRALVSETAGTTRDYLSAILWTEGMTFELIDTAGWDVDSGGIAGFADAVRQQQWEQSDLIVWCTAADLTPAERSIDQQQRQTAMQSGRPLLPILTKGDRVPTSFDGPLLLVSAATGNGLKELTREIVSVLASKTDVEGVLGATAARCRDSLVGGLAALQQARSAAQAGTHDELIAVELREAIDHLGKIVGRVYTDDILDRIFSRFCIGK